MEVEVKLLNLSRVVHKNFIICPSAVFPGILKFSALKKYFLAKKLFKLILLQKKLFFFVEI